MITAVTALLTARLAFGSLLAAGIMHRVHPVPVAYLRFVLRSAAVLLGISMLLSREWPEALLRGGIAAAALLLGRRPEGSGTGLAMAGLGGAGALLAAPIGDAAQPVIAVAASASGVFLIGAVTATMLLGHWYLVDTSLSIRPLAVGARLVETGAWTRIAVVALALASGGYAALRIASPEDLIYSSSALFFSFRAITGLLAPAVLAFLIRRTVRIRSTQSATGLLYVALILVLFGELTAVFLETATSGSLV